jgi:probable HAF family extracellular repeat protein
MIFYKPLSLFINSLMCSCILAADIQSPYLGPDGRYPTGVSADGSVIVGMAWNVGGANPSGNTRPFRLTASGLDYLPILASTRPFPSFITNRSSGVSDSGNSITGNVESANGSYRYSQAFRYKDGIMQGLGSLYSLVYGNDALSSAGTAISADGNVIAGYANAPDSVRGIMGATAFRWVDGSGMVDLGDLPGGNQWSRADGISGDGKVVVGVSSSANSTGEAFRWSSVEGMTGLGFLATVGRDYYSDAVDASFDGSVIVGNSASTGHAYEAFVWKQATGMIGIGVLPGDVSSQALAISGDGRVVVGNSNSSPVYYDQHAFIWTENDGMQNLQTYMGEKYGIETGILQWATGISTDGCTIVGWSEPSAGSFTLWIISGLSSKPTISIYPNVNNTIRIEFTGVLEQSTDLLDWSVVTPQPTSPYTLVPASPRVFFRSRK